MPTYPDSTSTPSTADAAHSDSAFLLEEATSRILQQQQLQQLQQQQQLHQQQPLSNLPPVSSAPELGFLDDDKTKEDK
jgi:hypothetical protein